MLCWLVLAALDDKVVVDWHASWRIAMFSSPLAEGLRLGGWLIPPVLLYVAAFFGPLWVSWKSHGFFGCFHDSGCGCWPGMLVCYGYNVTFWILNTKKGVVILSITSKRRLFLVCASKITDLQRHRKWRLHNPLRIEIARGYDQLAFREDLKKLLIGAGTLPKILGRFEMNQKTRKIKEEQTFHCVFRLVIWIVCFCRNTDRTHEAL